ncbi:MULTISPECIES: hypothetical protein [Pirellulaceae]|uniref:hypothetical protein n=1 Tax=Pirellulaceae TaxID=2691357 RepID=UPI0011B008F6|nr:MULTISPECIES: hypothetical protein [Pirellulaceae]
MIRLHLWCLGLGVVFISAGALMDSRHRSHVSYLSDKEQGEVWGGQGACYISADFSCGMDATNCPAANCVRNAGTLEWECDASRVDKPIYEHYGDAAGPTIGKDALTAGVDTPCNIFYYCGCDTTVIGTPPCSGDDSHVRDNDEAVSAEFINYKVDWENGNYCPDIGE